MEIGPSRAPRPEGRPPAQSNGRDDLLVRPAADACRAVRRDVGRVDGPERALELLAARVRLPLGLGVTTAAGGGAEDVLPSRDVGWASGPRDADREGHETGHQQELAHDTSADAKPGRWFHHAT